jgi:hypothetical protein
MEAPTTFVSAFMNIYETPFQNKDLEWRFMQFHKLCQTGIPLAVFCSRDCEDYFRSEILTKYPNVLLLDVLDLSDTWTYKTYDKVQRETNNSVELPNTRNPAKDTQEYLLLMNAKTEYIIKAVEKNPFNSSHFAWIDFNIFHIFGGKEGVVTNHLRNLSRRILQPYFLSFPGCWSKEQVVEEFLINDICWRWCGGFIIGSGDRMLELHKTYTDHFENFLREKRKLVWEVNFWAYLELRHGLSVVWYPGDHNETILLFNAGLMSVNLSKIDGCSHHRYNYPDQGDYIPTSISYVCHKGVHMMNTRFVNYWLYPNGAYLFKDPESRIITKNFVSVLDDAFIPLNIYNGTHEDVPLDIQGQQLPINELNCTISNLHQFKEVVEEGLVCHGGSIYGLEDIRLYNRADGELGFIGTSVNYSGQGRGRIISGIFNGERYTDCRVLNPPNPDSWCEKNWIPIIKDGADHFIYKWWPFEAGIIKDNTLVITTTWEHKTPMLSNVRGSSTFVPCPDGTGLIGVVHFSYEGSPRRYYHMLVLLDQNTLQPLKYSDFFVFNEASIEFCIGFTVVREEYHFWISNFDRDPERMSLDKNKIPLKFDFYYGV